MPDNETLLDRCRAAAGECAARRGPGWLWVETAGGVLSPGPSGTPQAQLYAPLRLPAVLVGDARLGGISQTLAAWEALRLRGYQVEALLLFGGGGDDGNAAYLAGAVGGSGPAVMGVAAPPARDGHDPAGDAEAMAAYYARDDCARAADAALAHLDRRHEARVAELESLAARAQARLWYPFTQQGWLTAADITVVDSAHGDLLQTTARRGGDAGEDQPLLRASFDGSASWWTQGLGHGHPALTLAAASAAGRYGHVLLAGTAHAPAVAAAEALLDGVASPRLRRVFFSDNGSTGVEAAVKMGLRAARLRYGAGGPPLAVLGLRGGYHGDTLGAMACAAPGPFNRKVEWYDGVRGHWLAHAAVLCVDGVWTVAAAADADADLRACLGPDRRLPSLGHVFDLDARERRGEHRPYEAYVARALRHLRRRGRRLGALVLEPVVLGAGGMTLVDPLFQRALVNVVRRSPELVAPTGWSSPPFRDGLDWSGLPVIFDEVFTGLYRLGRFTSASFLGVQADISVHAKLLTGGLVPLCATLASEAVFDAFRGPDPSDALLHGHSYTAHPVGCQAAVAALRELRAMERHGAWDWAKMPARGWAEPSRVWSVWPASLVERLSRRRPRVKGVWALGSVLAVHLDAGPSAGYGSDAAAGLRDALARGRAPWSAHVRVLGNVLYVMASQTTAEASVGHLASLLDEALAS